MKIYYVDSQNGMGDKPCAIDMQFSFENWRIVMGKKGSHSWGMAHRPQMVFDLCAAKMYRVPSH